MWDRNALMQAIYKGVTQQELQVILAEENVN